MRGQVREHFRDGASSFDHLYDEEESGLLTRLFRSGLFNRRKAAIDLVRTYKDPRVLDIGCGSGRIAEVLLKAGAADYLGIDFSDEMVELSRKRLATFGDKVKLLRADFLDIEPEGQFDVIVALGLFDYLDEPARFTRKMYDLCRGSVVASFPKWTWIKGPLRHFRYEIINNCPIYNFTRRELELLFHASGFASTEIKENDSGFVLTAHR